MNPEAKRTKRTEMTALFFCSASGVATRKRRCAIGFCGERQCQLIQRDVLQRQTKMNALWVPSKAASATMEYPSGTCKRFVRTASYSGIVAVESWVAPAGSPTVKERYAPTTKTKQKPGTGDVERTPNNLARRSRYDRVANPIVCVIPSQVLSASRSSKNPETRTGTCCMKRFVRSGCRFAALSDAGHRSPQSNA
jgi:hypothetical protein